MRSQTVMVPKTEYSFDNKTFSSESHEETENKHRTFSIMEEIEQLEPEEQLSQIKDKTMECY